MKIKFVNYTGKYPVLCLGMLTLRINGREVTFGDSDHRTGIVCEHRAFWESGGIIHLGENNDGEIYITEGAWAVHEEWLPDYLKPYSGKLAEIMNINVPLGHCGGCL